MTVTADAAPRQNGHGQPCPPWCEIDHAEHGSCVGSGGSVDHIWTRAVRAGEDDIVHLGASLPDPSARWPYLSMDPREAEDLAVIVELLAAATPAQHRQLAAAIRKAAADITEASHA